MRLNVEPLEGRETPATLGSFTVADSIPVPAAEWTPEDFPDTVVPLYSIGPVEYDNMKFIADEIAAYAPVRVLETVKAANSGIAVVPNRLTEIPRLAVFAGEFTIYDRAAGIAGRLNTDIGLVQDAGPGSVLHELAHTYAAVAGKPDRTPEWDRLSALFPHHRGAYFSTPIENFAERSADWFRGWEVPGPMAEYLHGVYVG